LAGHEIDNRACARQRCNLPSGRPRRWSRRAADSV